MKMIKSYKFRIYPNKQRTNTLTTTIENNTNIKIKNKNDSVIGVDVGLTNWLTLSDGQVIDRPKFLAKSLKKIKTLQHIGKESHIFQEW